MIGLDLDLERLSRIQGLTLRRAQVLGYRGQPVIQIAFTDTKGAPFAFCILQATNSVPLPGASLAAVKVKTLMDMAAASWQEPDHGLLIIVGQSQTKIFDFAVQLNSVF